ncbi:YhcB family protein [Caviibacterium pharyngocola]|uniref:Z-ring associated protein G n=1 Tax=Caviibacterium pharyngocola TaxID=28159 RepID=A0A2M8RYK4_9PAST|nr:DUF1043 family protein [Caviibacterium pharyngocola]PJG83965.1 DUF1043 domain-containing protein [Caviibacterium pharyngocola]
MQNLSPEVWQGILIGLVVGVVIGYILVRLTKGSVKKQVKTEAELNQVKTELNEQKQQLEKHFAESADLLKTLAQDYQKLYRHLASSSVALLPEQADKEWFGKNLIADHSAPANAENPAEDQDSPPRDYSEGSSGLLKTEK